MRETSLEIDIRSCDTIFFFVIVLVLYFLFFSPSRAPLLHTFHTAFH